MAEEAGAKEIFEIGGKELSESALKASLEAAAKNTFGEIAGIGWRNEGNVINEALADGLKTGRLGSTAASQDVLARHLAEAVEGRGAADTTAHVVGEGAGTLAEREAQAALDATEKELAEAEEAAARPEVPKVPARPSIANGLKNTIKKFAGKNAGKITGGLLTTAAGGFASYKIFKKGEEFLDDTLDDFKDARNTFRDSAIDPWMHGLLSSLGVPDDQICPIETALATGILVTGAVVAVYEIKKLF